MMIELVVMVTVVCVLQVQRVLQEHTRRGEVVLLVSRGGRLPPWFSSSTACRPDVY